jgi:hypothetical protein
MTTFVGVCGTDGHIHEGEFISKFPVTGILSINECRLTGFPARSRA